LRFFEKYKKLIFSYFIATINTIISDGRMPGILLACPIVAGITRFKRASDSVDSPETAS
jgi:hypothetical protein